MDGLSAKHGKRELRFESAELRLAKRDLAAVKLHEVTDDGQPEPGAARLFVPLLSNIEDDIPCLGWEAGAIVLDDELD